MEEKERLMNTFSTSTLALLSLLAVAVFVPATVTGQNLTIPVGQQGAENIHEIPGLGMDKTYVEENFGRPLSVKGPVGDPPITTWVYSDYTVYFEYNIVIHTVLKPKPSN